MDPLSEVLALLDVQVVPPCRLEVRGQWALRFTEHRHVRVGAVLTGHMWLITDEAEPLLLHHGDCYLLASGRPYTVASEVGLQPEDGMAVFEKVWPHTVHYHLDADGEKTTAISGAVSFDDTTAALLLDHLPPVARIRADSPRARSLRPALELLGRETSPDMPGTAAMRDYLTLVLFVQTLRSLIVDPDNGDALPSGWLGALSDDRIGAALALIHRDAARSWTVGELAAASKMSRSAFAERFRAIVGLPPLDYLARWRVHSAGCILRSTDRTVSSLATQFGFSSDGAFSRTFKRVTGQSPTEYRRSRATSTSGQFPAAT